MESICIIQPRVENPVFTIAIPTFKRATLLKEAVESALNQSYAGAYDVIVVDNNPDRGDDTELMMKAYHDNARVGYYKNSVNLGMTGNWNKLYELARGEYVMMLHDDDLLYDSSIEIVDRFMRSTKYHYECIYSMRKVIRSRDDNSIARSNISFSINGLLNYFFEAGVPTTIPLKIRYREKKFQDFSTGAVLGIPSGMTLKRNAFQRIGAFSNEFYPMMDQEFAFRAAKITNCCELKLSLIRYYIGVNESQNPQTAKMGMLVFDNFYKTRIKKDLCGLWKVVASLSYRFNLRAMCIYAKNFINNSKVYESGLESIKYKKHFLLDTMSMICWFAAKTYLIVFRTRSISLG